MENYLKPEFLSQETFKLRRDGKVIGYIAGCFDIIHLGHINLFKFVKKYVDVLVVGLDHDRTIELSKGRRSYFNIHERTKILNEIKSVDYVLHIDKIFNFNDSNAHTIYEDVVKKIRPQVLSSASFSDSFIDKRINTAHKFGINYLPYNGENSNRCSSSDIRRINKI